MRFMFRSMFVALCTVVVMMGASMNAATIDSIARTAEVQGDNQPVQSATQVTDGQLSDTLSAENNPGAVSYLAESTYDNVITNDNGDLTFTGTGRAAAEKGNGALGSTYASTTYEVFFTPDTNALYNFELVMFRIEDAFDPQQTTGSFFFTDMTTGADVLSMTSSTHGGRSYKRFPGELSAGHQYRLFLNAIAIADHPAAGTVSTEFTLDFTVTEVPEPGTAGVLLLGCTLLRRRRHRDG